MFSPFSRRAMILSHAHILILVTIGLIGSFYVTTLRAGHDWGGDFSMYIHHAKNIVEGRAYQDTGYIQNPFARWLSPRMYPPVYPLFLSAIYAYAGLNLTAIKIGNIFVFLLALFLIAMSYRRALGFPYTFSLICLLGFNVYFWEFKDKIFSDILFLFLTYCFLYLVQRRYESGRFCNTYLLSDLSIIVCILLICGTRLVGIVFLPSLLVYEIVRFKKLSRLSIIVTIVFACFYIAAILFLNDLFFFEIGFFKNVVGAFTNFEIFFSYWKNYAEALYYPLWFNTYSHLVSKILFMVIGILSIIGFFLKIKNDLEIHEAYFMAYSLMILPLSGPRYLIPIMPLFIFYFLYAMKDLFSRKTKLRLIFVMIIFLAIFISYVSRYTTVEYGHIREGIHKQESIDLFYYVKTKTNESDIFIFRKPRVLSFYTGRKASVYHLMEYKLDLGLWKYFYDIQASYIIESIHLDTSYFRNFIREYESYLHRVYANHDFRVYQINSFPELR
jgi:hypothetical protein